MRALRQCSTALLVWLGILLGGEVVYGADPGLPFPSSSEVNDQKAGSVLLFSLYTSSATNPVTENTRVGITNLNATTNAFVHIFLVAGTGSVWDTFVCLTPSQTVAFLVSDIDPGGRGYIVAVAVGTNGCPINFNFLTGEAYVKLASGHSANLSAEAIAAIGATPAVCGGSTTTLNFDGTNYNLLARTVAIDKIRSASDGNTVLLALNRLGGNLINAPAILGSISGELIDDMGVSYPFSFSSNNTQMVSTLSNTFPVTTPVFGTVIPSGRTGWMTLFGASGSVGLFGATINFNSGTGVSAFRGGHNLRKLTLADPISLTIPIFPTSC